MEDFESWARQYLCEKSRYLLSLWCIRTTNYINTPDVYWRSVLFSSLLTPTSSSFEKMRVPFQATIIATTAYFSNLSSVNPLSLSESQSTIVRHNSTQQAPAQGNNSSVFYQGSFINSSSVDTTAPRALGLKTYTAIGDSYIAGDGLYPALPADPSFTCLRTESSYLFHFSQTYGSQLSIFNFPTCSGTNTTVTAEEITSPLHLQATASAPPISSASMLAGTTPIYKAILYFLVLVPSHSLAQQALRVFKNATMLSQ